jgi:hypothetical protein
MAGSIANSKRTLEEVFQTGGNILVSMAGSRERLKVLCCAVRPVLCYACFALTSCSMATCQSYPGRTIALMPATCTYTICTCTTHIYFKNTGKVPTPGVHTCRPLSARC